MIESNLLIDSLSHNVGKKNMGWVDKDESFWISSKTLDTLMTEEDEEPSRIKLRPFTRKTAHTSQLQININGIDPNMSSALSDIKENCSRKTFSEVKNLLENFNKLRKSAADERPGAGRNLIRRGQDVERSSDHAIM